jgi:hypothetical protein
VYSRLSEYALRRLNFSQRFDSITIQADRNALPPVLLTPFRAGPPHIVQLGRYGSRSQRHRRAIASKAPAGLWVANNTRATYESESALMSNLPLGSARLLVGCRGW